MRFRGAVGPVERDWRLSRGAGAVTAYSTSRAMSGQPDPSNYLAPLTGNAIAHNPTVPFHRAPFEAQNGREIVPLDCYVIARTGRCRAELPLTYGKY